MLACCCGQHLVSNNRCVVQAVAPQTPPTQVVRGEGSYPGGRVHVELLPAEVHGEGYQRDLSMRRIEAVLGDKEIKEHCAKEMLKVGGVGWLAGDGWLGGGGGSVGLWAGRCVHG